MRIGYFAVGIGPLTEPAMIKTVAVTTERLGFSTLWAPEHVVLLSEYSSRYPYSAGEFPMPVDTPFGDPFTTLTYAAAMTSKIRLATGICLVPEHNPLVLAKTVATRGSAEQRALYSGHRYRLARRGVRGDRRRVGASRPPDSRVYRGDAPVVVAKSRPLTAASSSTFAAR